MLALSHQYGKSFNRRRTAPSAAGWAAGFEKVLEDPVGLKTFTEFLKREFSAENIMFWILCEHYRNQNDKRQRKKLAKDIVDHHLLPGAPEPINIDSHTRQKAIESVEDVPVDLFVAAQKQIFTLMKFDCYQRFLKSDLYAESLTAEKLGKPLPCQDVDVSKSPKKCRSRSKSRDRNRLIKTTKLNLTNTVSKDCNDNSTGDENSPKDELDEKKRKSLLPWQKGRGKSTDLERSSSRSPVMRERNTNFRRSKRKTVENKAKGEREQSASRAQSAEGLDISLNSPNKLFIDVRNDVPPDFCRLRLPDSSAAVMATNSEELVGDVIQNLLAKHGLPFTAAEAFVKDSTVAVDLNSPFSSLSGKEVTIERRIMVRLELPCGKIIAVKSHPGNLCCEVLEPVLKKYGLCVWDVTLKYDSTKVPLNLNGSISSADSCKLIVRTKDALKNGMEQSFIFRDRKNVETASRNVTSHIFEEVKKKGSFSFDELGILDLENGQQEAKSTPDVLVVNDADVTRRSSLTLTKDKTKARCLYSNRASIHETPVIKIQLNEKGISRENAPRKSLTKNVHYRDSCDIAVVWKRAQKRLDDQRGTELNCELPDFLRVRRDAAPSVRVESDL